jgi:hypothetical protein
MVDDALKQVPKFNIIFTEERENKEDIIQRTKEAKVLLNNKTVSQ